MRLISGLLYLGAQNVVKWDIVHIYGGTKSPVKTICFVFSAESEGTSNTWSLC